MTQTRAEIFIERCDISVGDDHIAVKAGLSPVAREGFPQYFTENVVVRHNVLRAGMGISIARDVRESATSACITTRFSAAAGRWRCTHRQRSAVDLSKTSVADNEVTNTTAFLRLDSFGRSLDPESYRPTAIRRISWLRNRFLNDAGGSDGGKRVRAKFICPSRAGGCSNISIINNTHSTPALASWHCDGISSFEVHGNTPGGRKMEETRAESHAAEQGALGPRRSREIEAQAPRRTYAVKTTSRR